MDYIIAIDPGPVFSAYVVWDGNEVVSKGILENPKLLKFLIERWDSCQMVIEEVRSYGMPVGITVFDTVWWSGRFCQAWGEQFFRVPRLQVKQYLCHDSRAKDSNIRQALIDRFGKPGTKKAPNLKYGEDGSKEGKLVKDMWAALALAVTFWDKNKERYNHDKTQDIRL